MLLDCHFFVIHMWVSMKQIEKVEMDINMRLEELLSGVEQDGDFVAKGEVYEPPPLMHLDRFGYMPYPLTSVVAPLVLPHATAAPYGRGDETIVDESVRKSWQIDAESLTLEEAWEDTLFEIVTHACAGLGVEGDVEANLYKMLIYEEGGFFASPRYRKTRSNVRNARGGVALRS